MLQNISVSNKGCSFQLSINQIITFYIEILSNTDVFNVDKIRASNQHIRMISEGSCVFEV